MKPVFTLLCALVALLLMGGNANAQIYLHGQQYIDGSASENDTATAIEVMNDAVMVAGNIVNKGTGTDAVIRKYNPDGTLQWSGGYFSNQRDWVKSFQCNLSEGLYAVGTTGTGSGMDGLLFKLDADGNTLWAKTYNGASNGMDVFNNLQLAPDNTVVVVGESYVASFHCNLYIAKYDAQGNKMWQRTAGNAGENAFTNAQIDAGGNIFASGFKYNGANKDGYIAKYNAQGKLLKQVVINGDGNKDDKTVSLHLEDNLLFAATLSRGKSGYDVAIISAYNPVSLALTWTTTYSVPTGDIGLVAGFDCNLYGDLLISGTQYSGGEASYLALSYKGASGALNWAKTISRGSGYHDTGIASTLDSSNTYILTGKSATVPNTGSPSTDVFTVGLDVQGNIVWTKITDGTSSKNDFPSAIGVNGLGELYIAGQSQVKAATGLQDDLAIWKYAGTKVCLTPTGLTTASISSNAATLSWDAMPEATKYKLQYRAKGGAWISNNTTATSKKLTGLSPNTTYQWKVKTICGDDPAMSSVFSAVQSFSTGAALQVSSNSLQNKAAIRLTVYPNPAHSDIRVVLQNSRDKTVWVQLADMYGKLLTSRRFVVSNGYLQAQLPIAPLAPGAYMVTVTGSEATYSQWLIKE